MLTALAEAAVAHTVASSSTISRAAEAATATEPFGALLQYGVLGLVVVGFITGWIVPGYQAKQVVADNQRLTALIEGKLLPMIETNAAALERATGVMEKATSALEQKLTSGGQG